MFVSLDVYIYLMLCVVEQHEGQRPETGHRSRYHSTGMCEGFQRGPQLGPRSCDETPVSRTALLLIAVEIADEREGKKRTGRKCVLLVSKYFFRRYRSINTLIKLCLFMLLAPI